MSRARGGEAALRASSKTKLFPAAFGNDLLGQVVTARINYEEATKVISVHVDVAGKHYEVSYDYNLTTIVPQDVRVGIAGSTGGSVAVHDIVSWYFTSTLVNTVAEEGNIRQVV